MEQVVKSPFKVCCKSIVQRSDNVAGAVNCGAGPAVSSRCCTGTGFQLCITLIPRWLQDHEAAAAGYPMR